MELTKREVQRLWAASKQADRIVRALEDIKARHPSFEGLTSQARQVAVTLAVVLTEEAGDAQLS